MVYLDDGNFVSLMNDKCEKNISDDVRKYGSLGTVCPQYNLKNIAKKIAEEYIISIGMKSVVLATSSYGFIYEVKNECKYKSFIDILDSDLINKLNEEDKRILISLEKLYLKSIGKELEPVEIKKQVCKIDNIVVDKLKEINLVLSQWLCANLDKKLISVTVQDNSILVVYK